MKNDMVIDWVDIFIDEEYTFMTGIDSFPAEGYEVLVSDGLHYDVAYYLRSGEYKWLKMDVGQDDANDFTNFVPTKWSYIYIDAFIKNTIEKESKFLERYDENPIKNNILMMLKSIEIN